MLSSTLTLENYTHTSPKILSSLEKIVEEWLKRSATCPLSVSLFDRANRFTSDFDKHPLVLQLLPFSSRLRHLRLTGDPELLRPLLRLGSEDLPILNSFGMECRGTVPDVPNIFHLVALQDVTIRMAVSFDPRSLPLQWSQLTKLCLECKAIWTDQGQEGGLDLSGAFHVLRMCPMLMDCEIQVTQGSGDADRVLDTSPIHLPHLQSLVLTVNVFQVIFREWIPYLVVPNLRSLQVGKVIGGRLD
ncbi:hypothetical protein MSAN_00569100 [Mycena sanguinolenta]|uniref:Uncharacterized protein n=1 Tax=Mycena sanguinolenta TaxID=230812 RepID=A0A8H7DHP9_9AGAR|nr:hypothetical protein MSAN_00569100 [Mycena sanguinolenta]